MINPQKEKTKASELDSSNRILNNNEVILGYSDEQALNEANRCLNCKNHPCLENCPLHNDIPAFINEIKNSNINNARAIIDKTSPLPFVCSRVCNQSKQCEMKCTRGINGESVSIGMLERYVCDHSKNIKPDIKPFNGYKVAIVGGGPSGLACAEKLALNGFKVTVFEKLPFVGGLLMYGIPHFRLPKDEVINKIKTLKDIGVEIKCNMSLGVDISLEELQKEFNYVYLAFGADVSKGMNIDNDHIKGVIKSNDFLFNMNMPEYGNKEKINLIKQAKNVVVTGGGNVAMDCARVARRNGSDVTIVYRRSHEEMPARENELQDALDEGIKVKFLTNPIKAVGNDKIEGIICNEMELGEPDESGRRRPIIKPNSEHKIVCDLLVYAIGSNADLNLLSKLRIEHENWGGVKINENNLTSYATVFAGGDLITGPNTVVHAVADGLKVANQIIRLISQK